MKDDYYSVLEVDKNASAGEIKVKYRKLAKKYHPDKHKGDKRAEEKFKTISEAYAVLSDPAKRKKYDMFGSEKFHQQYSTDDIFRGSNVSDILREFGFGGDIFNKGFGGGQTRWQTQFRRTAGFDEAEYADLDLSTEMAISFDESVKGGERRIGLKTESGTKQISVKIPPGMQDGGRLRLAGKGRRYGRKKGDLYISIRIAPHQHFRREGDDLSFHLDIKISTALMGGSVDVDTLGGTRTVKIPPGTQSGQKIRIKGHGVKHLKGSGKGDLYIEIGIQIPKKITEAQKKLAELLETEGL
ncbi:MAG: integrase [bacterium]|nr:MAG: integrase [bacterium]